MKLLFPYRDFGKYFQSVNQFGESSMKKLPFSLKEIDFIGLFCYTPVIFK